LRTKALFSGPVALSPSIIASDLSVMGETVKSLDPAVVDLLHMDVMDGRFVPNLTFGAGYIRDLAKHTLIPKDVHLMIERPEDTISSYTDLNPWGITIHHESTRFPARILSQIREKNIVAGLSINPATPVEAIFDLLPYADMVLIMSVDPGFYGQPFMPQALKRIEKLASFAVKEGLGDLLIQVDGGINKDNIGEVVRAGARIIVAGGSAFRDGKVNENVSLLKKSCGF
jgi:ribulose-phosphate 3-epimerase